MSAPGERLPQQGGEVRVAAGSGPAPAPDLAAVGAMLEELDRELSAVEAALSERDPGDVAERLHRLRRSLRQLERLASPPAVAREPGAAAVGPGRLARRIADRLAAVQDLHELASLRTHERLLDASRMLVVLAAVFLPLLFLAGVYGMNFSGVTSPWSMPELRSYWGYPAVLAIMAALGLGALVLFRRRGWLGRRSRRPAPDDDRP